MDPMQVIAAAQNAILDRVARFAQTLVKESESGEPAPFEGYGFEILSTQEREIIRIEHNKETFLQFSRSRQPISTWQVEKYSADDLQLRKLQHLLVRWTQRFDIEKFKMARVHRTTEVLAPAAS